MATPESIQTERWFRMPSGLYVSGPMEIDGERVALKGDYPRDIDAFNARAEPYGIHMNVTDHPIDRMALKIAYLSKERGDGSRLPSFPEDIAFTLESAQATEGELAGFYDDVASRVTRVTADILLFHECLPGRRYRATIHRFNADAILEPIADITIAGTGFIEVLGTHGYPTRTREEKCQIQNTLDIQGLDDYQRTGHWCVQYDRVDVFMVIRGLHLKNLGLLNAAAIYKPLYSEADVATLCVRNQTAGDANNELHRLKEENRELRCRLEAAKRTLG